MKRRATSVINRLNNEINAALPDPKIKARLEDLGATVLSGTPADFGKLRDTEKRAGGSGGQNRRGINVLTRAAATIKPAARATAWLGMVPQACSRVASAGCRIAPRFSTRRPDPPWGGRGFPPPLFTVRPVGMGPPSAKAVAAVDMVLSSDFCEVLHTRPSNQALKN